MAEGAPRHHMLGGLGFENAYALAMARKRAGQLGLSSLADLARHAPQMSIAGDYEFFGRPEWKAIRETYGLAFRQQRQMQAEFMYPAAAAGEVDVISAYTSDGRIAQFDLQVLDDPRNAIPPYDAILLVSPKRASDQALRRRAAPSRRCHRRRDDARGQPAGRRGRIGGGRRPLVSREAAALSIVARMTEHRRLTRSGGPSNRHAPLPPVAARPSRQHHVDLDGRWP